MLDVRRILVVVVALGFALAACGGDDDAATTTTPDGDTPPPEVDESDPYAGRIFTGGRIDVDGEPVDVPQNAPFTIEFISSGTPGNGTLRAFAGCSELTAGYTVVDEGLMTNGFISADQECDEAQIEFDQLVRDLLRSPATLLEDDTLTLQTGELGAVLADESA